MNRKLESIVLRLALLSLAALTSNLFAAEKAVLAGRVASTTQVGFDIYIPIQHRDQLDRDMHSLHDQNSANYHKWLTPAQFNSRYGATAAQISAIQKQLATYSLQSTMLTPERIHVTGNAAAVEQALGTTLKTGTYKSGRKTVVASQPIIKPSALAATGAIVTGLSGVIRMRTYSHVIPQNRYAPNGPYWFDDLKQAYNFPSYQAYTGKGVTIGILMANDFNPPDMNLYFGHEKLAVPNIQTINVDGGAPFDPDLSFETHLDLQQSGGMAPDAKILLYNLPDLSDASIIDGLSLILADNKADVVSMSFGQAEIYYTASYPFNGGTDYTYLAREEDDLMAKGNAMGITFVAASGDLGALEAFPPECFNNTPNCGAAFPGVSFPASSPHVVGVGGTNLVTTYNPPSLDSTYIREQAIGDPLSEDIFYGTSVTNLIWGSGGGDSIFFRKPLFQFATDTGNPQFRTVPDLSLHMGGCPIGAVLPCNPDDSADLVTLGGQFYGVVGTSASSPAFAGLTALTIQRLGSRLGNENYYIYTLAALQNAGLPINVFRRNIPGFNGVFYTNPNGYDRVLGNGTLNGVNFMLAPSAPTAGIPQTPSNP